MDVTLAGIGCTTFRIMSVPDSEDIYLSKSLLTADILERISVSNQPIECWQSIYDVLLVQREP